MCTERLNAQSYCQFEHVLEAEDSALESASTIDYGFDNFKIQLQLNMGDHASLQLSSTHRIQEGASLDHYIPIRTLSTASPTMLNCATPDLTYSSVSPRPT